MKFVNLLENDILLKEYIELCYFEWSSKKELDIEKKYYNIKNNIGNKSILIIGLVKDNILVGFISLLEKDGEYEENISPWYATMYIKDEYRGLGYSKLLNDELLKRSYELGYEKIYLKTDLINYYEKFNAVFIKSLNNGENLYYINTKR